MMKGLQLSIICGLLCIFAWVLPVWGAYDDVDLVVSASVTDYIVTVNSSLNIQVIVANVGTSSLTSDSTNEIALYLVTDASKPDEWLDIESGAVPEAGGTRTVTLSLITPNAPGIYYLYAVADNYDIIKESDEQNNHSDIITLETIESPGESGSLSDLRVTSIYIDEGPVVVVGDRMSLNVAVENAGDGSTFGDLSGRFDVALYSFYLSHSTKQMEPLGRMDLYFDYALDFEDPDGLAGKFSKDPDDPNEADVYTSDPLALYLRRQFSMTTVDLLDSYDDSEGDLPASLRLQIALQEELNYIISGDSIYDEARFSAVELPLGMFDLINREPQGENLILLNRLLLELAYEGELRSCLYDSLDPGSATNAGRNFPVPELAGTYYYVAVANKGGLVHESDEANNWGNIVEVKVIGAQPDLVVTSTAIAKREGDTIYVTAFVENIGGADNNGGRALLYLFTDPLFGPVLGGPVVAQQELSDTIVPGGMKMLHLSFDVADPLQTYYLALLVETDDGVESDETNNWGETVILQLPDLAIAAMEIMESVSDDVLQVMVRVQNINQADIDEAFTVELFHLSDATEDTSGKEAVISQSVSSLAAGESKTLIMTFTYEDIYDSGYFVAVADINEFIAEADESNNRYELAVSGVVAVADVGIELRKMTIKADKNRSAPWDSFTISGTIDATAEELIETEAITVSLATQGDIIYIETIDISQGILVTPDSQNSDGSSQMPTGFTDNWKNFSGLLGAGGTINGRVTSKSQGDRLTFRYKSTRPDGITSLALDLRESWQRKTGTFLVEARKIDLAGLYSPVTAEISFGDYLGRATVDETVINGRKPVPMLLLSGVADTLRVDSAVISGKGRSFSVSGAIAAAAVLPTDLSDKEVTITCGTQIFTIPIGSFSTLGRPGAHKFTCQKVVIGQGTQITAVIDIDSANFTISIKNSDEEINRPITEWRFGVSFEGFAAETLIN